MRLWNPVVFVCIFYQCACAYMCARVLTLATFRISQADFLFLLFTLIFHRQFYFRHCFHYTSPCGFFRVCFLHHHLQIKLSFACAFVVVAFFTCPFARHFVFFITPRLPTTLRATALLQCTSEQWLVQQQLQVARKVQQKRKLLLKCKAS